MDEEIPFYIEDKETDSLLNKIKRVFTSSLLFIVSFILSNLLLKALIAKGALLFKYTVIFSYNWVKITPKDYHYWSRSRILLLFFFIPSLCFLLGLFIYNLLRINSTWSNVFRIFFLWLAVCLTNMILTHALIAPLGSPEDIRSGLYQTFAVVGAWLYLNPAFMFILSIVSLIASIGFGMLIRNELLRYSFSKKLISDAKGMNTVVTQVYLLPIFLGAIPVLGLCSQMTFFTVMMQLANLCIIAIGVYLMNSIGRAAVRCNKDDVLNHYPVIELGICASVWAGKFLYLK